MNYEIKRNKRITTFENFLNNFDFDHMHDDTFPDFRLLSNADEFSKSFDTRISGFLRKQTLYDKRNCLKFRINFNSFTKNSKTEFTSNFIFFNRGSRQSTYLLN